MQEEVTISNIDLHLVTFVAFPWFFVEYPCYSCVKLGEEPTHGRAEIEL